MIVCLCRRLSDRDIERAVQAGVRDFDELQDETCIARNCACCEETAREVLDRALDKTHKRQPARLYQIEEPAFA